MADLQVQKTRGQREAHELRERLKELEERETELLKEVEALQSAAKVADSVQLRPGTPKIQQAPRRDL